MRQFFAFGFLLLIAFGCCCPDYREVDFDNIVKRTSVDTDEIIYAINTWAPTLNENRKHKIILEDSVIFYDNDYLDSIWIKFITQDICELWDARRMLVDIVEGLLTRLNNDARLVPFARDGVFTPENIDVYIVYESYFIRYVDPLYVQSVVMEDGMSYFYAADVYTPSDYWHQRVEPYHKTRLLNDAKWRAELPMWQEKQSKKDKSALLKIFNAQ